MGHTYMLEAVNKKSVYEKEEWCHTLKNGVKVKISIRLLLIIMMILKWLS